MEKKNLNNSDNSKKIINDFDNCTKENVDNNDNEKIFKHVLIKTDEYCTNERRSSITNTAIGSSLAASLVGISSSVSTNLLNHDSTRDVKSTPISKNPVCLISPSEDIDDDCFANRFLAYRRKSRLPLIRTDLPQPHSWSNFNVIHEQDKPDNHLSDNDNNNHHHLHFPHIPVPSFSFTSTGPDGNPQRKFSFGIRRHSNMVSQAKYFDDM